MIDQLVIGNKASFDDFSASVAKREINSPKKKSIKETVPFSNKTYDFSAINGEVYWEERQLKYVFEIIADTPTELEDLKTKFSDWVMNVIEENLHDPHIPDYHFVATFDDISYQDEESLEKSTITVTFSAYPYKISNEQKTYTFELPTKRGIQVDIFNASSHKITPTFNGTTEYEVWIDVVWGGSTGTRHSMPAGEVKDEAIKLEKGNNTFVLNNKADEECVLTVSFNEEVV